MSERMAGRGVTVAVLCAAIAFGVVPGGAVAQAGIADVDAAARRASSRFTSAARHMDALGARADSLARALATPTAPEIVRAGPLVARVGGNSARPDEGARVARTLDAAWVEMQASLGSAAAGVAADAELHWTRDSVVWGFGRRRYEITVSLGRAKAAGASRWLPGKPDSAEALATVLAHYGDLAIARVAPILRNWAGGWTPTIRLTHEAWERVAVVMATAVSSRARDCFNGVMGECAAILKLGVTPGSNPWREWYRPEDWPAEIATWHPTDPADLALQRACARKRDLASCELATTRVEPHPPVPSLAMNTLLWTALQHGGPDAFARLTVATGTPAEILRVVSGTNLETLIAEWRAKVVAARPKSPTPSLAQSGAMLFWVVAFGLIATRRRP